MSKCLYCGKKLITKIARFCDFECKELYNDENVD